MAIDSGRAARVGADIRTSQQLGACALCYLAFGIDKVPPALSVSDLFRHALVQTGHSQRCAAIHNRRGVHAATEPSADSNLGFISVSCTFLVSCVVHCLRTLAHGICSAAS